MNNINSNGIYYFDNLQIEDEFEKCFSNSDKPGSANNKSQENQQLKKVSDQENSPERDFLNDDEFFENYFPNSNDLYPDNNKPQKNQQLKNVSYQENSMEQLDLIDVDAFVEEFFFNSEKELCSVNNKPQENQQQNVSYQESSPEQYERFDYDKFIYKYYSISNDQNSENNAPLSMKNNTDKKNIYQACDQTIAEISKSSIEDHGSNTNKSLEKKILKKKISEITEKNIICSASDQTILNNNINTTGFTSKEINKRANNDLEESSNFKKQKKDMKESVIALLSRNKNLPRKITEISKSPQVNSNQIDLSDEKNPSKTITTISKSSIEDQGIIKNGEANITNDDSLEISKIIKNTDLNESDVIFGLFKILSPNSRYYTVIARKILPYVNQWLNKEITINYLQKKMIKISEISKCMKENDKLFFDKILNIFKKLNEKNKISGSFTNRCGAICSKINPWLLDRKEEKITVGAFIHLIEKREELEEINKILKPFKKIIKMN